MLDQCLARGWPTMTVDERGFGYRDNLLENFPKESNKSKNAGLAFLAKEFADKENFFSICRALFHLDHEICIGASLVLGHMKDKRAIPYLLRALLTTDQKRAQAFMWSLGEIGDDAAIPFLLAALRAKFVPKSAILALGKIGHPRTVDALLERLNDDDEAVRLLAVKALGQIRFGQDNLLINRAKTGIKLQLTQEGSRRVKLLLSVIKNRLEKSLEAN